MTAAAPEFAAQRGATAPTSGILPFVDATASSATVNAALSQTLRSEIAHATRLGARVIGPESGVRAQNDAQSAVALGRAEGVDVVLLGTILQAAAERTQRGGRFPRVRGQSGAAPFNSVSATVTIQAELYSVAMGERIGSLRVVGRHSDTHLGGTLYTSFGQLQSNRSAFMDSPLGRALQKAMTELTRQIAALNLT